VYWNTRTKSYSVLSQEGERKGKVIAHVNEILLAPGDFLVSKAGNARVRSEHIKNVHAFIHGLVYPDTSRLNVIDSCSLQATYNPYEDTAFVDSYYGVEIPQTGFWVVHALVDKHRPVVHYGVLNDYEGQRAKQLLIDWSK
jgi:hypothetical protein